MRLAPRVARERRADGVLRLRLDREHHAVLVGERPAQDDEARIHERVHEGRVCGQSDCSSNGRDASQSGPERSRRTRNIATLAF